MLSFSLLQEEMGFQDEWNRSLVLGLGFDGVMENSNRSDQQQPSRSPRMETLDTCLTLSLSSNKIEMNMASDDVPLVRQSSSQSTVTSFTNPNFNITSIKRERDAGLEDFELERVSSRASDDDDDGSGRKKLRLTKEQSALLEDNFKEHSTLNPKQKHALAMQLHLRPRQVEVWFQNRRARTKLKQTEVDCDYLKRCCEALRDENRRLHKELLELKALKLASSPLYMPLPAATLTMCPSCQLIGVGSSNTTRVPFAMPPKSHNLYNPFSNLSRAC